jgi:type VI secretion system secreted protein VgrG
VSNNNLKLAFASLGDGLLDVRHFAVHEAMNELFEVTVVATSPDDAIDLSAAVGKGAAFKLETGNYMASTPVRVWAGVVAHMSQDHAEPQPGVSIYNVVIAPMFWRTTLRRNSRIFQHLTTPDIVKQLLAEWKITPVMKLKQEYKKHEYCVQYGETDFQFICRLLEDAGISFSFSHDQTTGKGEDITKLVLNDTPNKEAPRKGPLVYAGHQTPRFGGDRDFCSTVSITQRVKPGKFTTRDFDFRLASNLPLVMRSISSTPEDAYEQFDYSPGAFWWDTDETQLPVADRDHAPMTEPDEGLALAVRKMDGERRRKLLVSFHTNALDLTPGSIVGINQESDATNHSRKDLAPDKKLLLVETAIDGEQGGEWSMTATGVFAAPTYRPERRTPKPKIHGVQSALVVGPEGQEIFTDEFGRVRVQFHWDREHKYDENSSCWIRVSQESAGGVFGAMNVPRVGHEVLVKFYEGDPDRPVIAGRLHNGTTAVPWSLPTNQTKSGWRSNSLPSKTKLGYNEISFEDNANAEEIHIQAETKLSYIVKNAQIQDIGATRGVRIGARDVLDVDQSRVIQVGTTDSTDVGDQYAVSVGTTTGVQIYKGKVIVFSTGGASIKFAGDNIDINAKGTICLHSGMGSVISTATSDIKIQGGPDVKVNNQGKGEDPKVITVAAAKKPTGPAGGPKGNPPFMPTGGSSIDKPLGVDDVNLDAPEKTKAKQSGDMAKEMDQQGPKTPATPDTWVADNPGILKQTLDKQRELLQAKAGELAKWDDAAKANFKQYFGTTTDAAKATISDRIQKELALNSKLTPANFVNVAPKDHEAGLYAFVNPDDKTHTIYIDKEFENAPLTGGTSSKVGALSHEMSHFDDVASTDDVVYGVGPALALARNNPAKALQNADSFEFYLEGAK